jgi:hypothetical protein
MKVISRIHTKSHLRSDCFEPFPAVRTATLMHIIIIIVVVVVVVIIIIIIIIIIKGDGTVVPVPILN